MTTIDKPMIEGQIKATHHYEIIVRLDNGSICTIHQAAQLGWHTDDFCQNSELDTGVVNRRRSVTCIFAGWHQLRQRLIRDEKWQSMHEAFHEIGSCTNGRQHV